MTRARELARLANENVLSVEDDSLEVGINSTTPTSALDVRGQLNVGTTIKAGTAGVVTATEFSGSIGTFSGAGSFGGNLDVTGNVTIGGTLTYEDVTNIDSVGIVTARAGVNVSGGQLQVGVAYSVGNAGVCTAAGFVGPLTGDVTGDVTGNVSGSSGSATGNAGGLTGTPNISCGTIAGTTGTFSGDITANGNITGDGSTDLSGINDATVSALLVGDSIVHTGDTNTKIRFPAADTFTAETGGSERLRCDSDGVKTLNGRFYSAGTYSYIESSSDTYSTLTLRKTHTDADSIDYLQCRDNSNTIKLTVSGDGTLKIIDSIVHEGDTNTKIRFPTTDTITAETSGSERVRINSSGGVGINTDTIGTNHGLDILGPAGAYAILNVKTQSLGHGSAIEFGEMGDDDYGNIYQFASSAGGNFSGRMRFIAGTTETMSLVGGKTLVGGQGSVRSTWFNTSTFNPALQIEGSGGPGGQYASITANHDASGYGARLLIGRTKGTSAGAVTIVADGDELGGMSWFGSDGSQMVEAAHILSYVDGTPGADDMPGSLRFGTTPDGYAAAVERLRITAGGKMGLGTGANIDEIVHFENSGNISLLVECSTSGSGSNSAIRLKSADSSSDWYMQTGNAVSGGLRFYSGSERFRIGANGEIKFTNSTITERMHYDSGGGIQSNYNHDVMTYGMVWFGATNPVAAWTMNIRGNGSTTFNDLMDTGTTTTFTQMVASSNASYYMTAFKIDGTTQTVEWAGGSAPSAATASGFDSYAITIFKSAANTYKCFGNFTNFDN